MDRHTPSLTDEQELPGLEAVLAATLALMTGYSQALQAELNPHQRLLMGAKIGTHLERLSDHVGVSEGFRRIALGLHARWRLMSACTAQSDPCATAVDAAPAFPAPARLQ